MLKYLHHMIPLPKVSAYQVGNAAADHKNAPFFQTFFKTWAHRVFLAVDRVLMQL